MLTFIGSACVFYGTPIQTKRPLSTGFFVFVALLPEKRYVLRGVFFSLFR